MELLDEILIEEYRGSVLENVHRGHICCINYNGDITHYNGNPNHYAYMRSTAKPLQAVPVIDLGLDKKYGFTNEELTIIAGSHQGAAFHIEALESIASKLQVEEETLVCLPSYPLSIEEREKAIAGNVKTRRFNNNCAGKHLGAIAISRILGAEEREYHLKDSPAQKLILKYISEITTYPAEKISIGIDGCGVPVFAMPLRYMALGYLRMACPELIENAGLREAAQKITRLMNENCGYVTNHGFLCTELDRDPNIFAKGGAQGVYCLALKKERIAVALKVSDGSEEEWPMIIASVLEQLGYGNGETIERIYALRPKEITNATGGVSGENRRVFNLRRV